MAQFVTEIEFFAAERQREVLEATPCTEGGMDHVGPFYEAPGHLRPSGAAEVFNVCEACGKGFGTGKEAQVL